MKSVVVTLLGGLGNQMFQYAMGRALSIRLALPLVLDISMLRFRTNAYTPRDYELGCFRLSGQRLRDTPVWFFRARNTVGRWLVSQGIDSTRFITEQSLQFDPEMLQVNGPCHLQGHWLCERYFESIAAQLREDFAFLPAPPARSLEYESQIRGVKSVGAHFRRGDFTDRPFPGQCSEDYYRSALEMVASRLGGDLELFVFSDDIDWCRQNVRHPLPTTFVDLRGIAPPFEELRLMSACRAFVMANSTFSWWAGWLNPRPDKVVIAPRHWIQVPGYVCELPNSPWLTAI